MDPITIALMMMAAGAAVKSQAMSKAADRASAEQIGQSARQRKTMDQSRDSVLKNLRDYNPTTRGAKQTAIEGKAAKQMVSDTTKAAQNTESLTPAASGNVSSDYLQGRAKSVRDTTNRASAMAGLLAKVRAPGIQRENEARKNADFASKEEILASLLRSRKSTGDQLVQLAGVPDSGKMALGSLLQTAGSAYAMGGAGGAAGAAGAAPTAGSIGPAFWDMMGKGARTIA